MAKPSPLRNALSACGACCHIDRPDGPHGSSTNNQIDTARIHATTFGIAAALAALAGMILAPIIAINPWMGVPPILKAFVVIVLGGLGSLPGAVLGGFLLGIIEAIGVTVFSSEWREVVALGVMMLVVWLRPQGLFGKPPREA